MRWNLRQKLNECLLGRQPQQVQVRKITNRKEILSYLERERSYSAAAIAHLEPEYADISKWLLVNNYNEFALCMISKSTSPSYLLTLGNEITLDHLLDAISLPGRCFATFRPQHLDAIERHYELEWCLQMKRMVVTRESFTPMEEEAMRLLPAHLKELNRLYKQHGGSAILARQLKKGVYYGFWRDGRVIAAAGTHLISPTYGIAYVGNVLTQSEYRNQGLATICTSAVTADLLDYCHEVVLSVEPHNLPAIRAYANLGYRDDCLIIEALGRRKSLVGEIITKFCKRVGLDPTYNERMETDG